MNPMTGVRILVGLVVLALVLWGVWLVLGMFPLPQPLPTIIMIILVLIALAFFANWWGGRWPGP